MELFSPKTSLFHKRWQCLNLTRKEGEGYTTFASVVNKHCDDFRLAELSADNFKCLIFNQGLVSTKDAKIRRRILNILGNEPNITLQQIAEDCQRNASVNQDSKIFKDLGIAQIRKICFKKKQSLPLKSMKQRKSKMIRPQLMFQVWYKDCIFRNKCFICNRVEHVSLHCWFKNKTNSFIKIQSRTN